LSRQAQKATTHKRVLDAAKELFQSTGYDAATIRAIAEHAGVSVGSVFNAYSSKSAILSAVMQERLAVLHQELQRVLPHLRGSTLDRLRSIFAIHYAFQAERVRTFLAHIASAYSHSGETPIAPFGSHAPLRAVVRETLESGLERGDVAPEADLELLIDLVLAAYAWNYRLAATNGADGKTMSAEMDRQLGLIFDGAGRRN
jgi:AcrR family transcriptional regulator